MTKNYNDKMSALKYVDAVSLATLESALFLDTHPENDEAFESFNHYNNLRMQAVQEYSKRFGPLTLAQAGYHKTWEWVNQPWPWEGGNC